MHVLTGRVPDRSEPGERLLPDVSPTAVLDAASRIGARVMRTDVAGAVQLATNGHLPVVRSAGGSTDVIRPDGEASAIPGEAGRRRPDG